MLRGIGVREAGTWIGLAATAAATIGCGGGDPPAPAVAPMQTPVVNLNPAPLVAPGAVADAPATGERIPDAAAVATLRAFLLAMVTRNQAAITQLSFDHPERAILWQGEPPPAEFLADAKREIDSIQFHKVVVGDQIYGFDGQPFVLKAGDLQAGQLLLTCTENPIPFFLQQEQGAWRVNATPIIQTRKTSLEEAAAAAAEAKAQTVQQPGVTPADQLGTQPPGALQPGAFQPNGAPSAGVQPIGSQPAVPISSQPAVPISSQPAVPIGSQPPQPAGNPAFNGPPSGSGPQIGTRPSPPPR